MNYPIVDVHTKDGVLLHGLYLKQENAKSIIINIHGTASNFYENYFVKHVAQSLGQIGVSLLSVNTSGSDILQCYPLRGGALECFEDCIKDIDAWVEYALVQGYTSIILQGHSLGTQKAVYYMYKGTHNDKITAVILLAFADSYGSEYILTPQKDISRFLEESSQLIKSGQKDTLLTSKWLSYGNVMPKSAKSYLNFMQEGSELSKTLPFHKGKKLPFYSTIKVPILAVIGDKKEYTVIPITEAMSLLKKENSLVEVHQLKDCDHDFQGKEEELAQLVKTFLLEKNILKS